MSGVRAPARLGLVGTRWLRHAPASPWGQYCFCRLRLCRNYILAKIRAGPQDGPGRGKEVCPRAASRVGGVVEVKVAVIEGRTYINATPHEVVLRTRSGEDHVVPPSGVLINARPVEEPAGGRDGVEFVRTKFVADEESARVLDEIEAAYPGAFIIGSIIAAQAFPGRVLAMVPVPGFERVPPAEKKIRADKFTVF